MPVVVAVVSAASAASVVSVVEGSGVAVIVSSFNCGCLETSTLAVSSPFFFYSARCIKGFFFLFLCCLFNTLAHGK